MEVKETLGLAVEEILEKKLEDIATVLSASGGRKSTLHEEVMNMVEKGLFQDRPRPFQQCEKHGGNFSRHQPQYFYG